MTDVERKKQRVLAAIENREADQVPITDFFWTNFIRRAKAEYGDDFNPYIHWDLDFAVALPNMDPKISGIEIIENTPERTLVKTGFGAIIERHQNHPMPHFNDFEIKTFEQFEALEFDGPKDKRRFYDAIDDQLNSVGDALNFGLPPFVDRVNELAKHLCVFGSVCEPHEMVWRIMGTENILYKMGEDPDRFATCIERLGDFLVGIVEGQLAAVGGKLSGMIIYGDIAYDHGMFFSPDYWRSVYMPQLKRICDTIHAAGLKTLYHGCGNASMVYEDMIKAGVDAYNPLEAKAGLNVVELKRQFNGRWAFVGNLDVQVLSTNNKDIVRKEVLTKLNAAKGGGYIPCSDHSVPDSIDPATYGYIVELVREYGKYPLNLGEFDIDI